MFVSFLPGKLILLPFLTLTGKKDCVQHRLKDLYSSSTEIIAVSSLQRFFFDSYVVCQSRSHQHGLTGLIHTSN